MYKYIVMDTDCVNIIRLYNTINYNNQIIKTSNYLGNWKYSTIILYNDFAYKVYPIVFEGEEIGLPTEEHINLILQEIGWQTIASKTSHIFNKKLAPTIYGYYIYTDKTDKRNRRYFIIKM